MKLQVCKFDYWKIFWCKQCVWAVLKMMLTLCVCVSLHSVCWWSGRSWSGWSPLPARSRGDSRWTGLGETPTTEGDKKTAWRDVGDGGIGGDNDQEKEEERMKQDGRWERRDDEFWKGRRISGIKTRNEANILRLWVSAGNWRQWIVNYTYAVTSWFGSCGVDAPTGLIFPTTNTELPSSKTPKPSNHRRLWL